MLSKDALPPPPLPRFAGWVGLGSLFLALVSLVLGSLILSLHLHGIGDPRTPSGRDVFFYLLTFYEPLPLFLLFGFFILTYLSLRWPIFRSLRLRTGRRWKFSIFLFALAVMLATMLWRHFGYGDYDVCIDESLPHFQSEIFLSGHLAARVPDRWIPLIDAGKLSFVTFDPARGTWAPGFLPLHSLFRVPAALFNLDGYMNAVLLAGNLIALYHLLRSIFPLHPSRAVLGAVLFGTWPQIIVMSATSFAMETHVLFTTLWLILYRSRNEKLFLLTPWMGVLCMGLHQPHIHLILAAPFVLRLAFERRFREFAYFGVVYLAGCLAWMSFLHLIRPALVQSGPLFQFSFSPLLQSIVQPANIALMLAWAPPLLSLLFLLVCLGFRHHTPFVRDCLLSTGLLFAFYLAWPFSQGHGWGYRFIYPANIMIVIVAIHGWSRLRRALGAERALTLAAASLLFTLCLQLPPRFIETRHFVGMHQRVDQVITQSGTDLVLLDTDEIWYGTDFVKNRPYLENKPVVLSLNEVTFSQVVLLRRGPLSRRIVSQDDLAGSGHPRVASREQD